MLLPPILPAMFTRDPPPFRALSQPLPWGQRETHALGFGIGPSHPGAHLEEERDTEFQSRNPGSYSQEQTERGLQRTLWSCSHLQSLSCLNLGAAGLSW